MSPRLRLLHTREIPAELAHQMLEITLLAWPPKDGHDPTAEEFANHYHRLQNQDATCALITDDDANSLLVAKAKLFPREILTSAGHLTVGALAGVCTHPDYRFHGLGAQAVNAVLEPVRAGELPLGLWQTGVPAFYEKLGARLVSNRFFNSLDAENPARNPWWEPHIMIYPADADWPEGDVDILGPGW